VAATTLAALFASTEVEDYKIDREEVFQFARKPEVSLSCELRSRVSSALTPRVPGPDSRAAPRSGTPARSDSGEGKTADGDTCWRISFASKAYCDVSVAIERADGTILRHLAYGVLGPNAPSPFQKGSLEQVLVWDGKNDRGVYIDELEGVRVRVSLGLKPRLERNLFWHPKKRLGLRMVPRFVAQPEGVYVYEGAGVESVKLFGHDGKYIRTVCPFPAADVEKVKGLPWNTFADGHKAPRHRGRFHSTYMVGGEIMTGAGMGSSAKAFTVRDGSIVSVREQLCRLGVGEHLEAHDIYGPETRLPHWPQSVALSPDKRWLYMTGFYKNKHWIAGEHGLVRWKHNVARMTFDGGKPAENWLGRPEKPGKDNDHFNQPAAVAVDAEGRVYVGDHLNDRVQVFSPEGALLKTLRMRGPAVLQFHHKTGELYAFCFSMQMVKRAYDKDHHKVDPALLILRPFESDTPVASIPIPFEYSDSAKRGFAPTGQIDECPIRVALDSYVDPPTVWINTGRQARGHNHSRNQIGIFRIEDNRRMVLLERWNDLVIKALRHWNPRAYKRRRMYVDPRNGMLYVAGHPGNMKVFADLYRLDPSTGEIGILKMPYLVEDAAIADSGHIYLRCGKIIGRFDLDTIREVPFDYGEERIARWYGGGMAPRKLISALVVPGAAPGWWHEAGMGVNPKGELVVASYNAREPLTSRSLFGKDGKADRRTYRPRVYPGRACIQEIHTWDKHGKLISEDVVKGAPPGHGTLLDGKGSVYFLASARRVYGDKPFHGETGTLIKFKPGGGRFYTNSKRVPVRLSADIPVANLPQLEGGALRRLYVQDAEWMYPGVGYCHPSGSPCECWNARFAIDHFGRVFAPENVRNQVAVLDTNGNLVLHVGRYGNVDDGKPLLPNPLRDTRYPPRSIGSDEVALSYANYVATHSDRRLFIHDGANDCIRSVKLGYHVNEHVPLPKTAEE